jgi:molybdopterin/thiamine biosynthesis adenylyltransferase
MIHEQFSRNLGVMNEQEVEKLHESTIAIAGCGCIGGFTAELLTRMGIGKLKLADPDTFDISNINRQCASSYETVGQYKAEALKNHLLQINPNIKIDVYKEGVNETNANNFVSEANYVVDAVDFFAFPSAVALHQASRKNDLFVITAVALGFGTLVYAFDPNGLTIEEMSGLPKNIPISEINGETLSISSLLPYLPPYATSDKIGDWINSGTIPTISVGQALGPGVLTSYLVLHLLGRKVPPIAPASFGLQIE